MENELVFSGVQPTGNLHLGNYLGAIKNWVDFQNSKKCIFCIVDLHAITVSENRNKLNENSKEVAAAYIASGIEPKKSTIFVQSNVVGHSELAWILGCHTPIGWLNRMTQFKDKAGKNKEKAPLGLYSYPVLMAADIQHKSIMFLLEMIKKTTFRIMSRHSSELQQILQYRFFSNT